MKNNTLRKSLIKSAVLLIVISLIIYLTISSPEGSVWNSIGTIFYTLFKAAQLVVGLVLALFVCLVVLGGIFFGCIAMVSTTSAAKMYDQLREIIGDIYNKALSLIPETYRRGKSDFSSGSAAFASLNEQIERLSQTVSEMRHSQRSFEESLLKVHSRLEQDEQNESVTRLSDWLREEEEKSTEVQKNLATLDQQINQVMVQVQGMGEKLEEFSSRNSENDITGRVADLEKGSKEVLSEMADLLEKVATHDSILDTMRQEQSEQIAENQEITSDEMSIDEHRLFSYIDSADERDKIIQLATEAVEQDMTYAQTTEYITGNIPKKTAGIIAEHPTLTQEFIKKVRDKN